MTREEFYKLTDILNSEVLGNFMHGGEADELIAMFEEAVEHSNILEQEEPVSEEWIEELRTKLDSMSKEDFKKVFDKYAVDFNEEPASDDLEKIVEEIAEPTILNAYGTKELARRLRNTICATPWKDAQGDVLPEIDREVIALLNNGKVVFAHRPYRGKYLGKSLTTGNIETFENQTYDNGEWNIPDVKYWLDCQIPKIEED